MRFLVFSEAFEAITTIPCVLYPFMLSSSLGIPWRHISSQILSAPVSSLPAFIANPKSESNLVLTAAFIILLSIFTVCYLPFELIIYLLRYAHCERSFELLCLSCFLEAFGVFANICAATRHFSCRIEKNLAALSSDYSYKLIFRKLISAPYAVALGNNFLLYGQFDHSLTLISILKPVRRAARRAFCPSLPIARES